MKIIPLSEGSFTIDKSKLFVPFDLDKDDLQKRSNGSLLVEVQPFVLITSEDIILIDAGLGFEKNGTMQIHQNLMDNGINPSAVTKVLLSHLHKDHAGGIAKGPNEEEQKLAFPTAKYYVQRKEFEFAFQKGFPSYITDELTILQNNPQVEWLDGNGILNSYIKYEITGAHSPFHQVFWVIDGGTTAFFGGDDAPQLQQMKSKFIAKYDYDGKKCMELRQQWWQEGREKGWTFMFYHDVKTPIYSDL